MEVTPNLYTYKYSDTRTYIAASAFIVGNILFPQLFHLIPRGGMIWLPIYFFTLIGAYKYGWRVGLLTAIASPLSSAALFGMPAPAVLPAILLKSTLLALIAGYTAQRYRKATPLLLIAVVLLYQFLGGLGEWLLTGSFAAACQDFRLGLPGMALQVVGGYAFIRYLLHRY